MPPKGASVILDPNNFPNNDLFDNNTNKKINNVKKQKNANVSAPFWDLILSLYIFFTKE
jgi:hypothetical protein